MDFGLSEEQSLLQETIKGLLENECPPTRLHEVYDAEEPWDPTLWKTLAESGIAGMIVPEEHGGAGLELIDLALVAEILGHQATPGPFLGHWLAELAIMLGGSDEQQADWLPALASGDKIGTIAFADSGGWLPSQWQLRAEGDRISGTMKHVAGGGAADLVVVGTAGGGLVVVGREDFEAHPIADADRTRRLWDLRFSSAPCDPLSGDVKAANRVFDAGLCLLAADAFGGATRCVELAVDHAKAREQFGRTIGHFQAVKHQLANMATAVEPNRGLFWYAAHLWDAEPVESTRIAALAKSNLSEIYAQVARDCLEAHGGIGFTWECDVHIWLKRSVFDRMYFGGPVEHRERAARLAGW
jgi:alkylation response protein AidB-like acyl-CoA dehydrogenase